jgi:urease accessory protein
MAGRNDGLSSTKQNSHFYVASESALLLLPEPVTCFRDASYNQIQKFEISEGGSVVILDWITSGRISRGEEWEFSRYYSVNDIWHDGKRIAKDVTLLDNHLHDVRIPERPLQNKLQPYSCYALLILYGPRVHHIMANLISQYEKISILKSKVPSQLIWSISAIDSTGQGVVARVGGVETETVKAWLKQALSGIEHIMGKDVYGRIFS